MSIKNCKKLDLEARLLLAIESQSWLLEVKHDRNPVFIVVSEDSVVGVCTVCDHIRRERLLRHLSLFNYLMTLALNLAYRVTRSPDHVTLVRRHLVTP